MKNPNCDSCESTNLTTLRLDTLFTSDGSEIAFSRYKCGDCGDVTLVTFLSPEVHARLFPDPNAAPVPVTCPRCEGTGEEPGAPIDLELGSARCSLCKGTGETTPTEAAQYNADQEDL